LESARDALYDGQVVGIFPEGGITRTGQVRTFKPGLSKIVDPERPVPIIPVYFHETWGSIFSYYNRKSITRSAEFISPPNYQSISGNRSKTLIPCLPSIKQSKD
jgi:1-acyl-sn-glycerol-3-phosphate acyltransferase